MDHLPSETFRKTYPRLTEPTVVTVHGHVLGTWVPGVAVGEVTFEQDVRPLGTHPSQTYERGARRTLVEFTPAPKPVRKSR